MGGAQRVAAAGGRPAPTAALKREARGLNVPGPDPGRSGDIYK